MLRNDRGDQFGWSDIKGGIVELGSGRAEGSVADLVNFAGVAFLDWDLGTIGDREVDGG